MATGFSWVPGAAYPGASQPADTGLPSITPPTTFTFDGRVTLYYWDYVDTASQEILIAVPGLNYSMRVVGARAGLGVPPPDGRWNQPDLHEFAVLPVKTLAEVRAEIEAARMARGDYEPAPDMLPCPHSQGPGVPVREPDRVTELHRVRALIAANAAARGCGGER